MSDTSVTDSPPVFGADGRMQGNLTSTQGQPPAPPPPPPPGPSPLAPQSPLSAMGPPPAPTPPPPQQSLNVPPAPQMGQQQKMPPAPDAKEYQKNSMAFASAMAVLGAVAGRFTRMPGNAALNAFAGALNGWREGNLERYEQDAKKWEQETKTTIENNRQVLEKYKLALDDRKMNIDEQMSQIQLTATQYHDQMMYDAAASKNYTLVASIYEKNQEFTHKVQQAKDVLQQDRDEQKSKNEQSATYWLSPVGQAELAAVNPDGTPKYSEAQKAGVKQMIDIYAAKSGGRASSPSAAAKSPEVAQKYKQIMDDSTISPDDKMLKVKTIAAEYGDRNMMTAAEERNWIKVQELHERAVRDAANLQERHESNRLKNAAISKFLEEHPNATAEEIQRFQQQAHPPRSAPGMALQKFMQEHPDATSDDIKKFAADYAGEASYQRTAGSSGARVENATNEVEQVIPLAVQASKNFPRGQYVPVNKLINAWEQGTSDPRYNDFITKNFALINAYQRAMNPQGVPRIAERLETHAIGLLSEAVSSEAYETQVRALWQEVQSSKTAVSETRAGRKPVDINSPAPGLDNKSSDTGWGKAEVVK